MHTPPATSLHMINGFDPSVMEDLDPDLRATIRRRQKVLGPSYRLFYHHPVEVVRAEGARLYDSHGRSYLDVYNNVPAVGHSHPRVTAAVSAQLQLLNTHTRYVTEPILDYAERLTALFPAELSQVTFTCTGSEAVDLALRIARYATGKAGVIATTHAYHGTTTASAEISPSLGPNAPKGADVIFVDAPDTSKEGARTGELFAARVSTAIETLERSGKGFAGLIVDSIFSSDGVHSDPEGFLQPVANAVRNAGGIFVADEVQPGFGRTGTHWWGFSRHGITPDLVVIGKPMGNGMPIAAVVGRPEVLLPFGADMRYFNTFAGNPVCIAAAAAVLDVIQDENLMNNAVAVGNSLRQGMVRLASSFPILGDVRGAGLFIGVDICSGSRPDGESAQRLVDELRSRRVLISCSGKDGNVLKIRPPLVFTEADAAEFLTIFAEALQQISSN